MANVADHDRHMRMGDLPAQHARDAGTPAKARARFFNSGNAFNIVYPPVPHHQFLAERDRAMDPATGTALIAMDLSAEMGIEFPATTPLVLARYARIRAGDALKTEFRASGEIYYVIAGAGSTVSGGDRIGWGAGDVFCLPGGRVTTHTAGAADVVLWVVTNEPQLAFENLAPPGPGEAPIDAVHYTAEEIAHQLDVMLQCEQDADDAGLALIFSSDRQQPTRNIMPTLTLAMNSLPPGGQQRPHRHNSVALNLPIKGQGCYSVVNTKRVDWSPYAMSTTPPGAPHTHVNGGDDMMMVLIVQDGGLHYHARTMGFEFCDDA